MTYETVFKAVGARIRAERERQGLTQAEVARKAGVFHGAISRVESGGATSTGGGVQGITLYTLYRIADALGVKPSSLLPE